MTTIRYRADSTIPYADAVTVLAEYSRSGGADLDFGPLTADALRSSGLFVTGPDLEMVDRLLLKVPGLYRDE